jgi:hypothetical protein
LKGHEAATLVPRREWFLRHSREESNMKRAKSYIIDRNRKAIAGTKQHYAGVRTIVLDGISHSPTEVEKILQDQIDAADAADAAAITLHQAVAAQKAANAKGDAVYMALKNRIFCDFKTSAEVLGEFGLTMPKRRKPKAATVAEAVKQREETRKAHAAAGSEDKPAETPAAPPQAKP